MARPKRSGKPLPVDELALLLRECYLTVYRRDNPHHDAPAWEHVRGQWRQIAAEMLRAGMQPPLKECPQ